MDIASLSKDYIMRRVGRIDQLASIRRYVLDDGKGRGSRAFEVHNGSGLTFTVYPDKGLDIGPAEYNGLPIAWMTPNGAVAPAFYDDQGAEWLRSWSAGLLTTCGWLNVGGPCTTPEGAPSQAPSAKSQIVAASTNGWLKSAVSISVISRAWRSSPSGVVGQDSTCQSFKSTI